MAASLHPMVNTVDSKIHMHSAGSAQEKTGKVEDLDFPMTLARKLCSAFLGEFCLYLIKGSSFARSSAGFCTPFSRVLYTPQLPSKELPSPLLLLQHSSCVRHTYLHGNAAISSGRRAVKVTQTKPAFPLPLCI